MDNDSKEILSNILKQDELNSLPADVAQKLEIYLKLQQKKIQDKRKAHFSPIQVPLIEHVFAKMYLRKFYLIKQCF